MRIILASKSPRRVRMMKERGYQPEIMPADIDESLPFDMAPSVAVMFLALKKAEHVAEGLLPAKAAEMDDETVIIAADTVVVYDGEIIGKPVDEEDAFRILSRLRGNSHDVFTGVCVLKIQGDETGGRITHKECICERTEVFFKDYSDEQLRAYVRTDEPYDKAGGYAIQETFAQYIDHIEGDYDNVVGFPMYRVEKFLCRAE